MSCAYITVEVVTDKGSSTYLIWQSPDESNKPGLDLYVERRIVLLKSGTMSWKYDGDEHVFHDVTSTASPSGWDLGESFGFADKEGAEYIFSASAFRRNVGTSSNVFRYELWDGKGENQKLTLEENYNFVLLYGDLTVYK